MEDNNDFEKFDEHKDSIETLLGTNEKSSSMTSRERVDDALENEGAEALSKFGVPKSIGKKAIKNDGGAFMPTNGPTQKMAKNYSRNKIADGLDKIDDAKNNGYKKADSGRDAFQKRLNDKDYYKNQINDAKKRQKDAKDNLKKASDNKDHTKDRLNSAKEKNKNIPRGQRTNQDKEDLANAKKDAKDAKKEEKDEKNNLKQAKKDEKNAKKDNLKSKAYMAKHPVEAAKMTLSNAAKKIGKKILLAAAPYILGFLLLFVLIFFVIELILGPLMEAWGYIDEAVTGVANFSEKLTNFYNGFGFQDSKEAFYDELEDLCNKYTCSNDGSGLDVPMLLSTLFYTEGMGYDTKYGSIEDSDSIDVTNLGTNDGAFSAVKEWLREKYDESKQTVDENGLVYNAGKIYRLRKLARNQFYTNSFGLTERRGVERQATLTEFLKMYGTNIANDISDMLKDFLGAVIKGLLFNPFKEVYAAVIGSKYAGEYFSDLANKADDFQSTFRTLISDIFYGLADITKIDIDLYGDDGFLTVNIHYREFQYDEDNYKKYLTNYYFEYMPEFKSMLGGLTGDDRERKKEQLYNDIVSNKKLFEDIFLKNQSTSSENYVESCIGAINQNLVNNLNKPVDIAENFNVSFSDNYSYGVVNGKNHNGVDLNTTTAGVNLGSNVYSVANGKIVSIEDSNCNDKVCGKSIKISHDINVDNETFKFFTIYSNVDVKSGLKVDSTVVKGDTIGTINNSTDNTEGLHFVFMDANSDANGIVIDPTNLFIKCTTKSSGTLVGDTIQDRVWNFFAAKGYNKFKIAAIMANINSESAFKTNNLENACEQNYTDETITEAINSGKIGKSEFIASTNVCKYYTDKNGNYDGRYGYGLSQWTAQGRKERFYNMKVEYNVPIDDEGLQLDLLYAELEESWAYKTYENTWRNASSESDIASATTAYCHGFEIGSGCDARISVAQNFYNEYKNK